MREGALTLKNWKSYRCINNRELWGIDHRKSTKNLGVVSTCWLTHNHHRSQLMNLTCTGLPSLQWSSVCCMRHRP